MSVRLRSSVVPLLALALVLGFALLGTRGIWDPDEGRYTNVAMNMLRSGDWINPHRMHEVGHWTKPPLTYWAIAASVAVFGANPWAARLPGALAYLLCALLVWRMARRLVPGSETLATGIYLTMAMTAGASQLITADFLLAAWETLAIASYVEARFGPPDREQRWLALMWMALALAFLTKGPPALVVLPVMLLFDAVMPNRRHHWSLNLAGMVLFVLLALPWYIAVIHGNPGLLRYFIGDEVVNRITTTEFGRNGQWYGWATVYLPTLLLGTLPWTPVLLRWSRDLPAQFKRWWNDPSGRERDAPQLLLSLWLLLPLLLFCLSRSRLPLYLLPLFAPLALLAAMQWRGEGRAFPSLRGWSGWVIALLLLRAATTYWPTHKDASAWADVLRSRVDHPIREVVFVDDMARYGLHLELGAEVEKISLAPLPQPQPRFNPEYDADLATELAEREPDILWICKQALWPQLQARIAAQGYQATALGAPYRQRVIFEVRPAPSLTSSADGDSR